MPPYRVIGTVLLYPGSEPDSLLNRSSEMFIPIVDATAMLGDKPLGDDATRRSSSTGPICAGSSRSTHGRASATRSCPGASMGGVNWTDRAR